MYDHEREVASIIPVESYPCCVKNEVMQKFIA